MHRRGPSRLLLLLPLLLVGTLTPSCGGSGMGGSTCTPTVAFPAGIEHGPMVAKPTPGSVVIAWRSVAPVSPAVEWGPTPAYGSLATGPSGTVHEIAIAGLTPGAPYHYRILLDGTPAGGDHAFRTPPVDPAAPVRFAVAADTGSGCDAQMRVISRIEAMNPDFVLLAGDLAYMGGTPVEVRTRMMWPFAELLATRPIFVALGNHDVVTGFGAPILAAMTMPTNPVDGSERFFSFDWGAVHVAVLDTNLDVRAGAPQITWLAADLAAASAARWKVLMFHHPVYSSSKHGSSPVLQATVAPLCDAHHVDLVFTGHDHDYERSHPMKAGLATDAGGGPAYVNPAGTIYVVSGGGGKDLYTRGTSSFTAYSESVHQAIRVDVLGGTLSVTPVRADGTTMDPITITKTP